jgi:predicted DNA-binding transcriptional regulator AlpA
LVFSDPGRQHHPARTTSICLSIGRLSHHGLSSAISTRPQSPLFTRIGKNRPIGDVPLPQKETTMQIQSLKPSNWVAQRLGISTCTLERLRSQGADLPRHVIVGRSIRYPEDEVEAWISEHLKASQQTTEDTQQETRHE